MNAGVLQFRWKSNASSMWPLKNKLFTYENN
jgi:hypothetical protein